MKTKIKKQKKTKQTKPQIVEIHIYIHQIPSSVITTNPLCPPYITYSSDTYFPTTYFLV